MEFMDLWKYQRKKISPCGIGPPVEWDSWICGDFKEKNNVYKRNKI
jgi:hypothetical protein